MTFKEFMDELKRESDVGPDALMVPVNSDLLKRCVVEIERLTRENERMREFIESLDGKTIAIRSEGDTFIDDGIVVAADILNTPDEQSGQEVDP
jgi:hypothetical protein